MRRVVLATLALPALASCRNTASPVALPNSAPTVSILAPEVPQDAEEAGPFDAGDGVIVEIRAIDPEDPPEELSVAFTLQQTDGAGGPPNAIGTATPDTDGYASTVLAGLSAGRFLLTATATDSDGASADARLAFVIRDANAAPAVVISSPPDGAHTTEGDAVTFAGQVADDRGLDGIEIEWFSTLDGVIDTSPPATGGLLAFTVSDLSVGAHAITVTATDPEGLAGVDTVTIVVDPRDRAPSLPVVEVGPVPSATDDDIFCVIVTPGVDPEGVPVTHAYLWRRDGNVTPYTTDVVPASATTKGEVWTCEVTASDGGLVSDIGSDSLIIENTIPEATAVDLGPAPAWESTLLQCTPSGWTDADGDPEGYEFSWEVGGVPVGGVAASTLDGASFDRGDVVVCTATPYDGDDWGTPLVSAGVLIENTPPTGPGIAISPAPSAHTTDTLSCAVTAPSVDDDGDPITYLYRWLRGGVQQAAFDGLSSVPASATALGETWTCEVAADDGTDSSGWVSDSTDILPNPGDLVISEFMADAAAVSDTNGEWVEVHNPSSEPISLLGFTLHDDATNSHTIAANVVIPSNGKAVLARNDDPATNGGVTAQYEYSSFVLANTVDQIVLSFGAIEVDRVNYDLANYGTIAGHSVSLDPALGPPSASLNDDPLNWCGSMTTMSGLLSDRGTPSAANDACACWDSDADGDGWGDAAVCANFDCNDNNSSINPAAIDVCENGINEDCVGGDALCACGSTDGDGDGYGDGAACNPVDCNDNNASIYPGAPEVCNGSSDDCDAQIDEGFDVDGDGFTTCAGDCNDNNAAIRPNAIEICNGINDDCDASIDEGFDVDNDGVTTCAGDCNDNNAAIRPGVSDVCNGINDDCDGSTDENAAGDGFEPNNTSAQAYYIAGDDTNVYLYATFHLTSDSNDWYWINTVDDTDIGCDAFQIQAWLQSVPAGTDYDLYLYDGSGTTILASSLNVGNANESLSWSPGCLSWGDDGGAYRIRVHRWSGYSCSDTYYLQVLNSN